MEHFFNKKSCGMFRLLDFFYKNNTLKVAKIADFAYESISINTLKNIFEVLKNKGYFTSKKGVGFGINSSAISKINNVKPYYNELSSAILDFKNSGYNDEDILYFVYDLLKNRTVRSNIYIVDEEPANLLVSKTEVESELNTAAEPVILSDMLGRLKTGSVKNSVIITTYYCLPQVKNADSLKNQNRIFPIKITPPIESIINFSKISMQDSVIVITLNNIFKERFENLYIALIRKYPQLRFYSIQEVVDDVNLISKASHTLTLKYIYDNYKNVFKKTKNLSFYSRFNDADGFEMLKEILYKRGKL